MQPNKLNRLITPLCFVALAGVGMAAQSSETSHKTKVEVVDGKDVKVSGCLERAPHGYVLTDFSTDHVPRYMLVTDKDYSSELGRRVEVKGEASDRGDGKVKVETKVKTSGGRESETTTESKGNLGGVPYLAVKSLKGFGESCG
jgi:hypothetical protein